MIISDAGDVPGAQVDHGRFREQSGIIGLAPGLSEEGTLPIKNASELEDEPGM